jgi:hypothetical protein
LFYCRRHDSGLKIVLSLFYQPQTGKINFLPTPPRYPKHQSFEGSQATYVCLSDKSSIKTKINMVH